MASAVQMFTTASRAHDRTKNLFNLHFALKMKTFFFFFLSLNCYIFFVYFKDT